MSFSISPLASWKLPSDDAPRPSSGLLLCSKSTWDTVVVRRTRTMGKGLFAARDIPQGGYILAENSILSMAVPQGKQQLARVKNHPARLFLDAVYALDARDFAVFMGLHSDPAKLARLRASPPDQDRIATWCRLNRRPDAVDEATRAINIWMTNRASVYTPATAAVAEAEQREEPAADTIAGRRKKRKEAAAAAAAAASPTNKPNKGHEDDTAAPDDADDAGDDLVHHQPWDTVWGGWPYAGDGAAHGAALTGVAVFPALSRINHSCAPNASWAYASGRPVAGGARQRIAVRALRDVRAGEQIWVSYLEPGAARAMSAAEKRAVFRESWGFACRCPVCRAEDGAAGADGDGEVEDEGEVAATPE
jgi:hypothetical protein